MMKKVNNGIKSTILCLISLMNIKKSIDNGQGFILQKPTEWEVSFMK